jgi:hypothetical protein
MLQEGKIMPLKRCGDNGWKYGDSGKCYTGKDAKKKAIRQGVAEQYHGGHKFEGKAIDSSLTPAELDDVLREEKYELRLWAYKE